MRLYSAVYILTNHNRRILYTGITNNLVRRVYEHKEKLDDGFTKKYEVNKLVYFEFFEDITLALQREKQIKSGSRKKKLDLINSFNPEWRDLYSQIL
ncbi:MAG: GIY-YIG nuclease family protein [Candidatus Shapirobacteria bacterium]|jgi:putative endonuclease